MLVCMQEDNAFQEMRLHTKAKNNTGWQTDESLKG